MQSLKQSLCRTCLVTTVHLKTFNIFIINDLGKKLFLCTGQPVEANDEYPEQICQNCYEKIVMFHDFQQMCCESLKKYLKLYKTKQFNETYNNIIEGVTSDKTQKDVENESLADTEVRRPDINNEQNKILERMTVIKRPRTSIGEKIIDADTSNNITKSYLQEYLQFDKTLNAKENRLTCPEPLGGQQDTNFILQEIEVVNINRKEEINGLHQVEEMFFADNKESSVGLNDEHSKEENNGLQQIEQLILTDNKESYPEQSPKCAESPEHECHRCSIKFKSLFRLQKHIRKQECLPTCLCTHKEKECGCCFARPKTVNSATAVLTGISIPTEELPSTDELLQQQQIFKCELDNCERVYKSKSNLNIHKRKFHNLGPQLKTHMCEICGKVFKSSAVLHDHKFIHVDKSQLPYACEEEGCHKRYCNKEKLKIHKMRHAGIKNFVCPHCGMRKTTRNELKIHINYHTLERTWPCRFCPKVCNSAGNLKMHVKNVHEGAKDFACRFCERTFAKADTKKYHEMTHTGEKPNECKECGRRFVQPAALRTHRKIHLKQKCTKKSKNNLSTAMEEKSCTLEDADETNLLTESIVAQLLNETSGS